MWGKFFKDKLVVVLLCFQENQLIYMLLTDVTHIFFRADSDMSTVIVG